MSGYYEDDGKLTFDEAEDVVDEWVEEYRGQVTTVTSNQICNSYDIDKTHHNKYRIHECLQMRFPVTNAESATGTRFRVQSRGTEGSDGK